MQKTRENEREREKRKHLFVKTTELNWIGLNYGEIAFSLGRHR